MSTDGAERIVLGKQLALGTLVTPKGKKCIALVICLAAYMTQTQLRNSVHDGLDMKAFLERRGFTVIFIQDGTKVDIENIINEFLALLGPGVVALIFYAGHAVEIDKSGYLLPVDFDTDDDVQAKHDAISLPVLVEKMSRTKALIHIVIIDACRSPLPGKRGIGGYLQLPPAPSGGIALFATSSGTSASDGPAGSRNGLFTMHLLKALEQPQTLSQAFMKVVRDVSGASADKQRPQTVQDLTNDFCFSTDIEAVGATAVSEKVVSTSNENDKQRDMHSADENIKRGAPSAEIAPSMLLLVVIIPDAVVTGHARSAALYQENASEIAKQLLCKNDWLAEQRSRTVLSDRLDGDPCDISAENIVLAAKGSGWTPSTIPEVGEVTHHLPSPHPPLPRT